jgi:geranylgeranyl diphosphate synthase type II
VTHARLDKTLASRRREIDAALARLLARHRDPARLARAMRYALLGSGKRFRPILALAAAEAVGGPAARRRILPFACAIEMIHAYSLVHDDLPSMDDDDMRRGRPSLHRRFDEATAILTGDALLTEAFAVMTAPAALRVCGAERVGAMVADLATAAGAGGMVGGQMLDLLGEGKRHLSLPQVAAIHRRKTGALIRVSVRIGAIAAHASGADVARLTTYGEALGLAFQIVDDILDETAGVERLGKQGGGDRAKGKATFPGVLGLDAARVRARSAAERARRAVAPLGSRADQLLALVGYVVDRAA